MVISDKSTIKNINISGRTQALANPRTNKGLLFSLEQTRGKGRYEMEIAGEPVQAGQQATLKRTYDTAPVNLAEPFEVEQVLVWELAPVRRIDRLELAYQSHRTVSTDLKARDDLKKLDPDTTEAPAATPGTHPGTPVGAPPVGAPPERGGLPLPGQTGGRGSTPADVTRINKIPRARYLHVKEQARHLPIAMRLIVDQAYIHEVLAAVANSRLRIQTTQVTMQQAGGVTRQAGGSSGSATGTGTTPAGRLPAPGGEGAKKRPPMPMPTPGREEATPKAGEATAQVQDTARLVELSIYGIATLYERFPPRKKPEPTPGAPGAPTTPPPGTAPGVRP
jgi:hypothetical protein